MLTRTVRILIVVPIVTLFALGPIGAIAHVNSIALLVPLGMIASGVVAGVLTSRDHGPGRSWATGIGAAALVLAFALAVLVVAFALADPGDFS